MTTNTNAADAIITLDHVYKIFGPQPRGRALKLAKDGLTKNEVQAATECPCPGSFSLLTAMLLQGVSA